MNRFAIATESIGDIAKNSVGIVEKSNGVARVLFIGVFKVIEVPSSKIEYIDPAKTGKGYPLKICNLCHILKPDSDFEKNQNDAKGSSTRRPSCTRCRVRIDGKKLTLEGKEQLDAEKPLPHSLFQCPICRKRSIVGVTANLVRDHDHSTGEARMWICDSCNTGLGRFNDSTSMLRDAIAYLEMFEEARHAHKDLPPTQSSGVK